MLCTDEFEKNNRISNENDIKKKKINGPQNCFNLSSFISLLKNFSIQRELKFELEA